jgi:NADH-quinone oxidoreductase subunit N
MDYILNPYIVAFFIDLWCILIFWIFLLVGIFINSNTKLKIDHFYFINLFKLILGWWIVLSFFLLFYLDFIDYIMVDSILLLNNLTYNFYTLFVKLVVLISAYFFTPTIYRKGINTYELYTIYGFIVIGLVMLILSSNFLGFYLGLELQSLALYVLIAYNYKSVLAFETSLKYYILGALFSGLLLLGISFIYGYYGTLNFNDLGLIIKTREINNNDNYIIVVVLPMILVTAAFMFKLSAVPFHFWAFDVYQVSSFNIIGFVSITSKLAVFFTMLRIFSKFVSVLEPFVFLFILSVAILSIVIGNIGGLFQTNIKKLLAYSTISNMGFVLLGFSAFEENGIAASIFYILVYSLTNLALILLFSKLKKSDGSDISNTKDLLSLYAYNPRFCYLMVPLLLSLAGLPPFGGFFAKYYVLLQAMDYWAFWPFIYPIIFVSILGSFYYLYIIYIIIFNANILPKFKIIEHTDTLIKGSILEPVFTRKYNIWTYFNNSSELKYSDYFTLAFSSVTAIFIFFFITDIFNFLYQLIQLL